MTLNFGSCSRCRPDVDLAVISLELARDAYPEMDFRPTLEWLEARAKELSGSVARARTESETLRLLGENLAEERGIFGDNDCFEKPDSSYLNRVIETGRGLPITLSILYMAVAQRVGIDLRGVSAPMHFLTRYEAVDGTLFVDPLGAAASSHSANARNGCAKSPVSASRISEPR